MPTYDFKYWKNRCFYTIIVGYASFYLVRQNFSIAVPYIIKDLQIDKIVMGKIMMIGGLIYGLGKFLFGMVGDKYNPRYVMAIGLFLVGAMNICLGISTELISIIVFYTLNQSFQAMGHPPCTKTIVNWFKKNERGSKWGIWNTSVHIGNAISMILAPFLLVSINWHAAFYVPGIIAILLSFVIFNRLRDTPESLGFQPVEDCSKPQVVKLSFNELVKLVLLNKYIWCAAFANLFVYINRMTFLNWGPTLLKEDCGLSIKQAGLQMVLFDIAGMLGGIAAGYISDKVFKGKRAPVATIYMLTMAVLMLIFKFIPSNLFIIKSICFVFLGSLMSAPIILVNMISSEHTETRATASAVGFAGVFGYLGTAISGILNGYLAETFGWGAVLFLATGAALVAAGLFSIFWIRRYISVQK